MVILLLGESSLMLVFIPVLFENILGPSTGHMDNIFEQSTETDQLQFSAIISYMQPVISTIRELKNIMNLKLELWPSFQRDLSQLLQCCDSIQERRQKEQHGLTKLYKFYFLTLWHHEVNQRNSPVRQPRDQTPSHNRATKQIFGPLSDKQRQRVRDTSTERRTTTTWPSFLSVNFVKGNGFNFHTVRLTQRLCLLSFD